MTAEHFRNARTLVLLTNEVKTTDTAEHLRKIRALLTVEQLRNVKPQ